MLGAQPKGLNYILGQNQGISENEKLEFLVSNLAIWKFGCNSHLLNIKNELASDNGSDPIALEIKELFSFDFS